MLVPAVRVNAVCPGAVWTGIQQRISDEVHRYSAAERGDDETSFISRYEAATPMKRPQTPADVAKAVAFLTRVCSPTRTQSPAVSTCFAICRRTARPSCMATTSTSGPPSGRRQIGYIVRDIEASMGQWVQHGVGPWFYIPKVQTDYFRYYRRRARPIRLLRHRIRPRHRDRDQRRQRTQRPHVRPYPRCRRHLKRHRSNPDILMNSLYRLTAAQLPGVSFTPH